MIYIAICDDNKKSVEILESKVSAWLKENHKRAEVHTYTQSQMLQYDIEEGQHYDLILSDIEMPQIDGMDLAAYMKRYLPDNEKYDWRKITQSIDRRGENDRTTGR